MKQKLKKIIEKIFGIIIFRKVPVGIDSLKDIKNHLNIEMTTIFDVGANTGQSAKEFLNYFKMARIHCFEPIKPTFSILKSLEKKYDKITTHNLALSDSNGDLVFFINSSNPISTMNSVKIEKNLAEKFQYHEERVKSKTLDMFCEENGIIKINFLKIDTEGNDMKVLIGAENMITENNIDIIQVECGMNPSNEFHHPFSEIKNYLEASNYYLFGIYNQAHDRISHKPVLRRSDAIFISNKVHQLVES